MPEAPRPYTLLAFDYGRKHVGVAVGQSVTGDARPLTSLAAKNGRLAARDLAELMETWQPDRLVVGLPLNMDGTESALSAEARRFARRLARSCERPVALTDERLTTREAASTHQGDAQHAQAAALIARGYFQDGGEPVGEPAPAD